ncbi:protein hydE [Helicobacter burdigaliensis]|uniref:protein hydE n=1 Tax=Helicobacter burdigaliensis TaxID=2315334 RepID=UPI000EF73917|nr:protein hydE [Helicobacter burdigaliensis]
MILSLVFSKIHSLSLTFEVRDFFLQAIINECHNITPTFYKDDDTLTIHLEGEETELLDFCQKLESIVPLSLQWVFKELTNTETKLPFLKLQKQDLPFLTPKELEKITKKDSPHFCNLWEDFASYHQNKLTLIENGEKIPLTNAKELQNTLKQIAQKLISKEEIFIKTSMGKKSLVLFDENSPIPPKEDFIFMPFCLNSTQTLFITTKEELQALATLEKPIIHLRHKAVFANFFPQREAPCILPFDPLLLLLTKFLDNYNGLYLLPPKEEKIQNGICAFFNKDIMPPKITIGSNSIIVPHNTKKISNILQEFHQKIEKENLDNINILYCYKDTKVLMHLHKTTKQALSFCFETNPNLILQTLKELNETTQKLVKNFSAPNKAIINYFQNFAQESRVSNNILDLMGVCGLFLGFSNKNKLQDALEESYQNLMLHAKNFMGNKGPRIDFKLEKNKDNISLNPLKTICSTMSFNLAGVDKELLSFGILDSLAEFFANFLRDLEENFQTKNVLIYGELFTHKQFLDKFIHYYPKSSEILPLDFCDIV